MAKFLFEASYSDEGVQGVATAGGSARRAAVEKAAAGLGGSVECFYFAFGDVDAYVVVDLPDNNAAAAMALAVNSSGTVTVRTVVLLTVEEIDAAAKTSVSYAPPGG